MAATVRKFAVLCCMLFGAAASSLAQLPPSVLQDIVIEGNTRTEQSVILRIIGVAPGETIDQRAFDKIWDRLEDCGYFAFVDLSTEEDDDEQITLYVTLEEEQTARYTPYLRYSPRHKYLLGATLRDINLRGRGEILEIQAIGYRVQRGHAAWTKPWFLGRDRLSLIVDALWEQAPFVWRPFDYEQWHARLGLRQYLAGSLYVEAGGGFESFRQEDPYRWPAPDRGGADGAGGEAAVFPAATRDGWVVTGTLGFDSRDNPFYPHRGMFHELTVTGRTGSGGRDATGYLARARAFIDLPGRPILALHATGYGVSGPAAIEHGLFWGGAETVRGAPYASREGEHGYLLSAELRWSLFLLPVAVTGELVGLGFHAFYDAGDAWFDGADPGRAMQSFGVGAHLNLLSWQLRFEAARERDHDWTFQFMDVFNF